MTTRLTRDERLYQALGAVESAIQRATDEVSSKQSRFVDPTRFFHSFLRWQQLANLEAPPYLADSRERDTWLRSFWKRSPHLSGVINSVVAIDKNRGWWLTGGRNQVNRYNNILRDAEDGAGWRDFISFASQSYYTADIGCIVEIGRLDAPGPLAAIYNVDPAACRLSGDPEFPLHYYDQGGTQEWSAEDFFRVISMRSTDQRMNGLGYCAVSRAIELVSIMVAIYEHDKEQLGAKAPRGLLLLHNLTEDQWASAMEARKANLTARERQYYADIDVLAGFGPDAPDAKLIALSQLPDNFDLEISTQLMMYGIALCFGYDPIEFWPVNAGALGRGRETDIQHRKGTGKGGLDFIFGFQDRLQRELPDSLLFQFEERDAEGEMLDAGIEKAWADVAAVLTGSDILSRDEVRSYLAEKGVIPAEWTEVADEESVTDEGERRMVRIRDELMQSEHVRRAIHRYPTEPIVRLHWPTGKEVVVWESGDEAMKRRAWSVPVLPDSERPAILRPRVQRQTEVLYEDDEVTITSDDVEDAIAEAADLVDKRFSELLRAEPEDDE